MSLTSTTGTKVDAITFPTSPNGVSMGSTVNSLGKEEWPLMQNKTKGNTPLSISSGFHLNLSALTRT